MLEEGRGGESEHHEGEDVHDESWPRLGRFLSSPFFPDLIKPRLFLFVPGFGVVSPSADAGDASESEDSSESHEDTKSEF